MVAGPFLRGPGESLKFSIQVDNATTGEVLTEMDPTVLCPDEIERHDRNPNLKTVYKLIGFIYQL